MQNLNNHQQAQLQSRMDEAEREIERLRGALFAVFDVCKALRLLADQATERKIELAHEQTLVEFLNCSIHEEFMEGHEGARLTLTPTIDARR